MNGVILFGHGARDARWREPFDKLVHLWRVQQPQVPVEVAFLELMQPSLSDSVDRLIKLGAKKIKVVPVFFGQGGHLRKDFPVLLEQCQEQHPEISLSASPAVGEDDGVLLAIIEFASRSIESI